MHWDGSEHEFRSPFDFHVRTPLTLVELRMRQLSGRIRAKPNWWEKLHDGTIVAKWRAEIVEQDRALVDKLWGGEERLNDGSDDAKPKMWPRDPITDAQLNYVFDELRHDAAKRDPETGIYVSLPVCTTCVDAFTSGGGTCNSSSEGLCVPIPHTSQTEGRPHPRRVCPGVGA